MTWGQWLALNLNAFPYDCLISGSMEILYFMGSWFLWFDVEEFFYYKTGTFATLRFFLTEFYMHEHGAVFELQNIAKFDIFFRNNGDRRTWMNKLVL